MLGKACRQVFNPQTPKVAAITRRADRGGCTARGAQRRIHHRRGRWMREIVEVNGLLGKTRLLALTGTGGSARHGLHLRLRRRWRNLLRRRVVGGPRLALRSRAGGDPDARGVRGAGLLAEPGARGTPRAREGARGRLASENTTSYAIE